MRHVMLDLETFGLVPGVALRSIGAVEFDLDGKTGRTFYANVSRASCEAAGLTIDPKTEEWWAQQSAAARNALAVDPVPLADAIRAFNAFFIECKAECVWSHGAAFDAVLFEAAACKVGVPTPWKFWNVRDTRTVFDVFGFDIRDIPRDGTYHNALDDAIYQVACVSAALAKGRPAKPAPAKYEGVFE